MLKWHHILFFPEEGTGGSGEGEGEGEEETSSESTAREGESGGSGSQPDMVPRSELAKANSEAAKRRKELREAQARIEELEGQSKTDLEKAQDSVKRQEEQNAALSTTNRNLRVRLLGEELGIVREARQDAAMLLDWSAIEDPNDEDQVKKALSKLVEARPYLLGNVGDGADGGAGGQRGSGARDMNAQIRRAAGRT